MSDHLRQDGSNPHLTEDGSNPHLTDPPVAKGVTPTPEPPQPIGTDDQYRDFMAERMEVYQCDPTVPPEIALQAVQTEATLRLADEIAKLREALDPNAIILAVDLDTAVTRWRMFCKMMENLAKSDKKRAADLKVKDFDEVMAGHAEAAQQ